MTPFVKLIRIFTALILLIVIGSAFTGCSSHEPTSSHQIMEVSVEQAQSNLGVINIPKVDPEFQSSVIVHRSNKFLAKSGSVDSSSFYVEKFIKHNKSEKLEIKSDRHGKSKIEFKKNTLPDGMPVVFEWAKHNIYEGKLYSPILGTIPRLSKKVYLELSFDAADLYGITNKDLSLYLFNEESNTWDKIRSRIKDNHLVAKIKKLGTFRIMETSDENTPENLYILDEDVFYAKERIEKDKGGKIKVGCKQFGRSLIEFDKYDLPRSLDIEFQWAASGTVAGRLNSLLFGPHGTNFKNPVKVELSYKMTDLSGIDETKLRVYYFNEELNIWEYIGGTVDVKKKCVIAYLNHFSRYAIAYSN